MDPYGESTMFLENSKNRFDLEMKKKIKKHYNRCVIEFTKAGSLARKTTSISKAVNFRKFMNNLGFCKQLKFCDTVFNLEQPEYKLLLGDGQVHIKAYNLFGHKLEALRV